MYRLFDNMFSCDARLRRFISAFGPLCVLMAMISGSCIRNDIPYPRIPQLILSIAAEGESRPALIDSASYSAVVYLEEQVDIRSVKFNEFSFTEGAEVSEDLLSGSYDLSSPIVVTLSKYQSYDWVISADQPIERYFEIDGQFGESVIDVVARRGVVRIPEFENVADLTLVAAKLGPADVSVMSPALNPGKIDLSRPLVVDVTAFGRTEQWTIYAEKTDVTVQTVSADPWSQVVWVYASAQADAEIGFQYKEASSEQWIDVDSRYISGSGGSFSCCIPHLHPLTQYQVRARAGEETANTLTVTTEATLDLPDGDFDQWWLDGKVWNPFNEGGVKFWDTGNRGAAIAGPSNVTPSDHTPDGSGRSAKLSSVFAGVFGIGKLAAGSIYTGEFVRIDGTNGILAFGREFNVRPTKLRGYFEYTPVAIDMAQSPYENLKGVPDSCQIYIALTDWTAPKEICTTPSRRSLFDPNAPEVIAYGEITCGKATGGYQTFEIELKYRSTSRRPRYIQITAASSKYGDYFTGGNGSVLYVDQFSLDYDY